MTGTLGGALEAREIPSHPDRLEADVVGDIEAVDGVLKIARVHVAYRLKVPKGKRDAAERALETHVDGCPVAQTLLPCVEIDWEAEIEEV